MTLRIAAAFLVVLVSNVASAGVAWAQADSAPEGMVLVPAGTFTMGTDEAAESFHNMGDSTPQHTRTLPAFYIDKTEVTNAQYKAYCDATGYPRPSHWHNGAYRPEQAQHPVTHVNWYEAQAYARWVGKRLPTEAEWEKAARGTDGRRYPWGEAWDIARVAANRDGPSPVGTKPDGASPYGALDMASNVFEWTADWYNAYPGSTLKVRGYGQIYKVIRGGGFDAHERDAATIHRAILPPQVRSEWAGFRCARDVDNSSPPAGAPNTPVAQ